MKAALIGINFDTQEIQQQFIEDGDNPMLMARGLRESIERDWPGYTWIITGDLDAREAYSAWFQVQLEAEGE